MNHNRKLQPKVLREYNCMPVYFKYKDYERVLKAMASLNKVNKCKFIRECVMEKVQTLGY